jgi:hypothetical protein
MRAAMATLLTKAIDARIIQSNPTRLAKYANMANSIAPSGKSGRRVSSSIHRLPDVGIIGFGLKIAPSFLCFSGELMKRMPSRQSGFKTLKIYNYLRGNVLIRLEGYYRWIYLY